MPRSKVAEDAKVVEPRLSPRVGAYVGHVDVDEVAHVLRARRDAVLGRWLSSASHIPELYDALVEFLPRKGLCELDADAAVRAAAEAHAKVRFERGLTSASVLTDCRIMKQEIGRALRSGAEGLGDVHAAELLVDDVLDCTCTIVLGALQAREASRHQA